MGFENILAAMGDIASTVRRLVPTAPQGPDSRGAHHQSIRQKRTCSPYQRPPPVNKRAVSFIPLPNRYITLTWALERRQRSPRRTCRWQGQVVDTNGQ